MDFLSEHAAPFVPSVVVKDHAANLKRYGLRHVTGDRYAGEWPVERYRDEGITYTSSEHTRSDLYRHLLPLLRDKTAVLLDDPVLRKQLLSLDRTVARGGRDTIDHPPGGHEDVANAAAGSIVLVDQIRRKPQAAAAPAPKDFNEQLKQTFQKALQSERDGPRRERNIWRRQR